MAEPTEAMQAAGLAWANANDWDRNEIPPREAYALGMAHAADLIAGDIEDCAARCSARKGDRGYDDPQVILFTMFQNEYLEIAAQIRGDDWLKP